MSRSLILALADDELVMGHRLSEWTGWVPYVEEDLALSSIAQDEIGHARAFYELLARRDGGDADAIALGRGPAEYRNAIVCEHPSRDFAYAIARHYLYDTADAVRLEALAASSDGELAELVRVVQIEERYHLEHAGQWLRRIALGPIEARGLLAGALTELVAEAAGVFEPVEDEDALVAAGVLAKPGAELLETWRGTVGDDLAALDLDWVLRDHLPAVGELWPTASGAAESGAAEVEVAPAPGGFGGRRGAHSADFEPMWAEMTALYRDHPGATW